VEFRLLLTINFRSLSHPPILAATKATVPRRSLSASAVRSTPSKLL